MSMTEEQAERLIKVLEMLLVSSERQVYATMITSKRSSEIANYPAYTETGVKAAARIPIRPPNLVLSKPPTGFHPDGMAARCQKPSFVSSAGTTSGQVPFRPGISPYK